MKPIKSKPDAKRSTFKTPNRGPKRMPTERLESRAKASPETIRINRYLALSGLSSRRKAEQLIEEGLVKINGKKIFELGVQVDPRKDIVTVQGQTVKPVEEKIYLLFNKPKNIVTTLKDPEGRPCLEDYLKDFDTRLFPVGRLDWDSEGLLLITNDGEFSQKVTHPSAQITKTYLVKSANPLNETQLKKLTQGVSILGGFVKALAAEPIRKGRDLHPWYKIVITEGKNRQIHKMFEKVGGDVLKLQRIAIGGLQLGSLERGEMRRLNPHMIEKIFQPYVKI